ncbi:hypothetical protein C2S53_014369 [Perilla frutescens var. hirtella]|uniref:Uncharacterized protein n=1 Tax=Perilla frutescens var. hirtella TaxID=608512 RepID=A0AAD4JFG7_PERFH|nr:hypothetical protein C2S53_014369 [Perilla frutescens var. hirtella]
MEAVMMHGSFDHSISPYKSHLKNPKKIHQNYPIISNPADFFRPSHFSSTGLLQPPPPPFLSQSYPPYSLQQSPQPPLLPLPTATPRRSAALSANKKTGNRPNRSRDPSSLTSKKSKSPKKEEKNSPKKSVAPPPPSMRSGSFSLAAEADQNQIEYLFSGSAAFTTISPPPSSLPLPTFSLRPKMRGCKAEAAAAVDAGATDDLRRLLRLR